MFTLSVNDIINATFRWYIFSMLFSFLVSYFISYLLSLVFFSSNDETKMLNGRGLILNILVFTTLFFNIFFYDSTNITTSFSNLLSNFKSFLNDSASIFTVISFIFWFYLVIYLIGVPMTNESKPLSVSFIDMVAWFIFIIVLISDFFSIFFNTSISNALLSDWINLLNKSSSQVDSSANSDSSANYGYSNYVGDEVFNISNNIYTYNDAKEVCSIYGAKLATYDQVEHSYNKGGEWCNYGWSEGQLALFPTQKSTWSKLQGSEHTKNQCGRPGINGGFMENEQMLFGVNCFGKKPQASDKEIKMMQANQDIHIPNTPENAEKKAKLDFLKKNKDTLLVVNSFKRGDWSEW